MKLLIIITFSYLLGVLTSKLFIECTPDYTQCQEIICHDDIE